MRTALDLIAISALRGIVVFAVAAALAVLLRRRPANLRHSIWMAAIAAQLALIVAAPIMPAWRVLPELRGLPAASPRTESPTPSVISDRARPQLATISVPPSQPSASFPRFTTAPLAIAILFVAWLAGVMLRLGRLIGGSLLVAREISAGQDVTEELFASDRRRSFLKRFPAAARTRIILGARDTIPFAFGVREPVVCLPACARNWPPDRLRVVLDHELVHVARHDTVHEFVLQVALAVYWFNPALWAAARRLRTEREAACDDAVVTGGVLPSAYVSELVTVLRIAADRLPHGFPAPTMASPSSLESRLQSILDERIDHNNVGRTGRAVFAGTLFALAFPLAALQTAAPRSGAASPRPPRPIVKLERCREIPRAGHVSECHSSIDSVSPNGRQAVRVRGGLYDGVTFIASDGPGVTVETHLNVSAPTERELKALAAGIRLSATADSIYATGPAPTTEHYWSVDYTIGVPESTVLDARTTNGRIVADGVHGTMEFSSINGPIELRHAAGSVHGRSENGPLRVDLGGTSWQGAGLFLESISGPIDLRLPHDFSAFLQLGTLNGAFTTDASLSLPQSPAAKTIEASIGRGGSTIHLQTMNGSLTVH